MKTCSRALRTSDWGKGSPSNKITQEWLQDKSLYVLERPSLSPDLNLIEHWRYLKIAVQQHSPSNLTELERLCREEWEKLPKYRCAKLVGCNRCQRFFNKVLSKVSEYLCKGFIRFFSFDKLANISKKLVFLCHYGELYVN